MAPRVASITRRLKHFARAQRSEKFRGACGHGPLPDFITFVNKKILLFVNARGNNVS